MPKYNTDKLKALILEKYGTQKAFADAAGLDRSTVSRLLERGDWRASQMRAALVALDLPLSDVDVYFFDDGRAIAQPHGAKK